MLANVFTCQECGAALTFAGRTTTCPYCASANVVERPAAPDRPNPVLVLPFADDDALPRRAVARWIGEQSLFTDSALRRARVENLRGIYVPGYLYSAVARSQYDAQIGENYTETETYTETNAEGKTESKTRTVTRTEWRDLSGQYDSYVTDVVVTASAGLPNHELTAVEPFDLRLLRRYDPALISGWCTEEPSRTSAACQQLARDEARAKTSSQLTELMPGDTQRGLAHKSTIEWETLDPMLLPVWVLAVRYRDDQPALRILVNGQTGLVHGYAPRSTWKIALAYLLAVALFLAIVVTIWVQQ